MIVDFCDSTALFGVFWRPTNIKISWDLGRLLPWPGAVGVWETGWLGEAEGSSWDKSWPRDEGIMPEWDPGEKELSKATMHHMYSTKRVIPSRFIYVLNSFSNISRKCILPKMIRAGFHVMSCT